MKSQLALLHKTAIVLQVSCTRDDLLLLFCFCFCFLLISYLYKIFKTAYYRK